MSPVAPLRLLVATGEVSGDVVGARLASEIRARRPDVAMWGIGGPRLAAAGVEIACETNHLGTVGVSEAFATATPLLRAFARVRRRVLRERPAAAILIGNDVFNVLLARWLKRHGVRTVSYFPPQVWIWRSLARPIARSFDALLACFPEEHAVYERAGGRVSFVGHYLGDALTAVTPDQRSAARDRLGLPQAGSTVALLPGSRTHEVEILAPILLDGARELLAKDPTVRFALPVAEPLFRESLLAAVAARGLAPYVSLVDGDSHAVMRAADLVILASGTASLEAALLGVPMVIVYRVAPLTIGVVRSCIRLGLIDSDTVGLPNLVLGRRAVPELTQGRVSPVAIAAEAWSLLADPIRRTAVLRDLAEVAERLGPAGSVGRAAEAVLAVACEAPRTAPALPLVPSLVDARDVDR